MLGSAVIVFREVLEAALIIGLVLVVTRDVPNRGRMVGLGILGGIMGAILLALMGDWIAPLAQGVGEELLNAGILLVAVVMLSWHLIWMQKHSKTMTRQIKQMGSKIMQGEESSSLIALIIGVAILREGSEIVLFMYGLSAAGSTGIGLLTGGLLGLLVGTLVGVVVYFGLVRVPLSYLFRISGGLILLLTAGLAAQASSYLVQANVLPALGYQLWDTSAILSEQSLLGQFLHIIIGYVAQPMGIQLLVYITTIMLISGLMYLVTHPLTLRGRRAALTTGSSLLIGSVFVLATQHAHASHKIYSPNVEEGEVELEMRSHTTFDNDSSKDGQEKIKLEAGFGVTERWFTGLGSVIKDNTNGDLDYTATFWENIIQFTEQGKYWVDVGVYLEYEVASKTGDNDAVEGKLLLEKLVGRYLSTANLVLVRDVGSGASNATQFEYAWRTKYLYSKAFEPGIAIYGEMGEVGNVSPSDQQDHRIGPVFSGVLGGSRDGKWVYEVGYLFGISDAAPDGTLKFNIEYEFRF